MVNASPTKPDFRASLIEALREGLVVSSKPKTDDELTESALDKLQYDFPASRHFCKIRVCVLALSLAPGEKRCWHPRCAGPD